MKIRPVAAPLAVLAFMLVAFPALAGTVTERMKRDCRTDYNRYCKGLELGSEKLRACMSAMPRGCACRCCLDRSGADPMTALHKLRCVFMRGGTSKALMFRRQDLPARREDWAPIFLAAMGAPDPNGRQLDGMGGGISSLSKVCVVVARLSSAQTSCTAPARRVRPASLATFSARSARPALRAPTVQRSHEQELAAPARRRLLRATSTVTTTTKTAPAARPACP